MRVPTVYAASEIATWHVSEEFKKGQWRPARPCPFYGMRLITRVRIAWRVFTGKMDALNWGDTSGEKTNSEIRYRDFRENTFIRAGKEKP